MIKRIERYDDNLKLFLESSLKTIEYFQGIPEETLTEIIYSLEFKKFDKGTKIF